MTDDAAPFRLDAQVGFLLRKAQQRHAVIFQERMAFSLTPTQFAAMAKLGEMGGVSQNELGRQTAMDAATIKGVVDRLRARGMVATNADPSDRRRAIVSLTEAGRAALAEAARAGREITEETLRPLSESERARLLALLARLA